MLITIDELIAWLHARPNDEARVAGDWVEDHPDHPRSEAARLRLVRYLRYAARSGVRVPGTTYRVHRSCAPWLPSPDATDEYARGLALRYRHWVRYIVEVILCG